MRRRPSSTASGIRQSTVPETPAAWNCSAARRADADASIDTWISEPASSACSAPAPKLAIRTPCSAAACNAGTTTCASARVARIMCAPFRAHPSIARTRSAGSGWVEYSSWRPTMAAARSAWNWTNPQYSLSGSPSATTQSFGAGSRDSDSEGWECPGSAVPAPDSDPPASVSASAASDADSSAAAELVPDSAGSVAVFAVPGSPALGAGASGAISTGSGTNSAAPGPGPAGPVSGCDSVGEGATAIESAGAKKVWLTSVVIAAVITTMATAATSRARPPRIRLICPIPAGRGICRFGGALQLTGPSADLYPTRRSGGMSIAGMRSNCPHFCRVAGPESPSD